MVKFKDTELKLEHYFDRKNCRHFVNGNSSVLHCHHYATLYTQLAEDCEMLDGVKLLAECAEDCFYETLTSYFKNNEIDKIKDRIKIAQEYYVASGLGRMIVKYAGTESGEVILEHSHVDEGWIKKWGKREKPVNYIACGYISGMFSAIFDSPVRTYEVHEITGIVSGAENSVFNVVLR